MTICFYIAAKAPALLVLTTCLDTQYQQLHSSLYHCLLTLWLMLPHSRSYLGHAKLSVVIKSI